MAPTIRVLSILVAGGALLGATACESDENTPTAPESASTFSTPPASNATTASPEPGDFRDVAEAICADVSIELSEVALQDGAAPVDAANALRSMVDANRTGVDRLRLVETPPAFAQAFESWLDLVDETAKYLEVGSLALRAGDNGAFAQALKDADATGVQASAAARDLGLPGCAFSE